MTTLGGSIVDVILRSSRIVRQRLSGHERLQASVIECRQLAEAVLYKETRDIPERLAISYEQMANQAQSVAGYDAC